MRKYINDFVTNKVRRLKKTINIITLIDQMNQNEQKTKSPDFLFEWVIWAQLSSYSSIELILLKGHLYLEIVLESKLEDFEMKNIENLSFYSKTEALKNKWLKNEDNKDLIIRSLFEINKMRNKLAHEYLFKIADEDIEVWSNEILNQLKGTKHTKFTFKTKFVHAFSYLSINILTLTECKPNE